MSPQKNEKVVRELYDAINHRNPDQAASLIAQDCQIMDVPFGETRRGPDGWREAYDFWIDAFPDGKVKITRAVATDTFVVVEYDGSGTHDGPLTTPEGEISPTGRRADTKFCDVVEVRNEKITRIHSYFDAATLMRQLGIMPEPAIRR
jgi:steroid delta-isomerase-like uncharacterized protein